MWKKKVTPSSIWTSKCVCWKEGEVPFAHPCLLSASFRRTLHYWETDLWSAEPTFQLEVCKDTLCHTKGLTPKKKPAAGLEGWFYYLIMEVLHTKEASTIEDTNGFTKSTLKTTRESLRPDPGGPACFESTVQSNLPTSRSLIPSASSPFPWKVTHPQVTGSKMRTSLWGHFSDH